MKYTYGFARILILGALLIVGANAQDEGEVHIGFKGGVSTPNLVGGGDNEVTRDYKSRTAYNFGGYVEYRVSPRFSVQTEVNFAPQGGKREGIQPVTRPIPGLPPPPGQYYYGNFSNTAKLNYLEIPVLFKYTQKRDGPRVYVNGGPYAGFLLKATQETRGTSPLYIDRNGTPFQIPGPPTATTGNPEGTIFFPPITWDADTDVTDSLNRFNVGLTGGGGIQFPVGKNYFFVDARAAYGFRTLQKNTATDGKSRTGYLLFSFGYAFKVRGR
ncbi:MAG: PorT family protein [Acidobacteriota bacterium]|nr:MAG: PorT family protein [Acidobacteriota bacterium]